MYTGFFEQELIDLSERYGAIGIHTCAAARHQWDNLKKLPNLKLLNLIPGEENLMDAYAFFKDICPQWNAWYDGGTPPWKVLDMLPRGTRCVITVEAETKEEALRLSEMLSEKCAIL
jgi:hypothetical protein